MIISIIITCFGIFLHGSLAVDSVTEACQSWNLLKKNAETDVSDVQLSCSIDEYCTGIACNGKYELYNGKLEVRLQHCRPPISAEVCLSVPKLYMTNYCDTFIHGKRVPIPKPMLDMHSSDNSFIEVYLKAADNSSVTFAVSIISSSLLGRNGNPISVTLLKNHTVKFPPCPYKKVDYALLKNSEEIPNSPTFNHLLTIKRSDSTKMEVKEASFKVKEAEPQRCSPMFSRCGEIEFCDLQSASSKTGICQCLPNYSRNSSGFCQLNPPVPSPSGDSSTVAPQADSHVQTPTQTAISIVVPIVIIIVLSALVVLGYKYRWTVKLRAMFMPSRRYEEMVIDGDEVGNLQSTGSDPVA